MAKAKAIHSNTDILEEAGECMMVLLPKGLWNTIIMQGEHEGTSPGLVLAKALKEYLDKNGSEEAKVYINSIIGELPHAS
jgi:hypothetical protein